MMNHAPPLIVHVVHRLDFGGLENGLVNLVNRMPPERYRHAVVCLSGFDAQFRSRLQRADIRVISLDKRPGKDIAAYGRMWRVLRGLRPAIMHTRNLGTVDMQWVAAAAGVSRRIHGEHGWEASDPRGRSRRNLLIRRACRPVIHRYVPMSRDIARWLEEDVGVEPSRVRQLYNGVDVETFRPSCRDSHAGTGCRVGTGTEPSTVTLGTVGRLDPIKNHAVLLRAFAGLDPHGRDLRLVIVGDGPLRATLEALARSLEIHQRVTFTGNRDDIPDLLRAVDLFVLPSINEGISNTILEAMASGLPVVASNVGGNPELVVDGVTGRLYDPTNADALATALLSYVTEAGMRRVHGEAGRARVLQIFSLEAMVQRYQALYDDMMETPTSMHPIAGNVRSAGRLQDKG